MHRNRVLRLLLVAGLVVIVIESAAALAYLFLLEPLRLSRFVWRPNLEEARKNWNAVSPVLDEEIGGIRVSGPKPDPEFDGNQTPCASAYGDSFASGAELDAAYGWVEQLSRLLGCRVVNYAVDGYGADQVYLHFRRMYDQSSIVLLGINPSSIMDIVAQYDGLLNQPLDPSTLKGRFLLDPSGHIEWLPRPRLDADGFVAMHRVPADTLPHSYFLPNTPDGPVTWSGSSALTLARVALMPRIQNILMRRAEWSSLYSEDHPSHALQLMVALTDAFVELAKARGKRVLVIMLPVGASFREQANHGEIEYARLVNALRAKNIETFDPAPAMVKALAGRSVCDFFIRSYGAWAWVAAPVPCGGHYSEYGNATMAKLIADELQRRKFIGRPEEGLGIPAAPPTAPSLQP